MEENKKQTATDDEIFAAYNQSNTDSEKHAEPDSDPEPMPENAESAESAEADETASPKKKRKRGIERHLYPCPHCGEQILDHFTECPKCGGAVKPRGYHVDEEKRKKVVRVFQIAGVILSVGLVALLVILAQI